MIRTARLLQLRPLLLPVVIPRVTRVVARWLPALVPVGGVVGLLSVAAVPVVRLRVRAPGAVVIDRAMARGEPAGAAIGLGASAAAATGVYEPGFGGRALA